MPDIEERLRTALATLADELEPAEDPRADLTRRLDTRRLPGRVAALAAAVTTAAAVVIAVAFLPSTRPPAPPTAAPPQPYGEQLANLGTVVRGGEKLQALGYLQGSKYCTTVTRDTDRTTRPTCEPVPTWRGMLVQSREVLNGDPTDDTGMFANRLVFLTDPRVATLEVRRGNGTSVTVTELDRNEHAVAFLADFAGPPDGFGYTARNAAGKILEEAIT
jgi:hypothetical protein